MTSFAADPTASDTLASTNPATGDVVGEVPVTPVSAVGDVVRRSHAAQARWAALGIDERRAALSPAGASLVARADSLGLLLTREMGKPLREAISEIRSCGTSFDETLTEIADALQPENIKDRNCCSTVHFDPLGVCAAITPWNFPLAMPHWTVIPALMAGNTVILKPSQQTPLIAQAYADLLNETLPPDALQVVHGSDEQGKALVQSSVDLIVFTGSREAGKHILGAASADLKRVILELGGKDPMIVLDSADVGKAAAFAVRSSFRNAGQVCVSTERIYIAEQIADEFETEFLRLTAEIVVGDGTTDNVTVGPMISTEQRDHVLAQLDRAIDQGATVRAGGSGHHDNFVMPTVLTNVNHDMEIMCEETFGPVACIMRFTDDDEAVRLANDTPFGLGACVFGTADQATRVARQLSAGMVGVNKGCGGAVGTPWVGARQSGYGYHSGKAGHRQFTQTRVVSIEK